MTGFNHICHFTDRHRHKWQSGRRTNRSIFCLSTLEFVLLELEPHPALPHLFGDRMQLDRIHRQLEELPFPLTISVVGLRTVKRLFGLAVIELIDE